MNNPSRSRSKSIGKEDLARNLEGSRHGLNLLYDGADVDHPDVDFVAVHGLGGHPLKSFTDDETGCCWLRDLLPLDRPHCRVLSYRYTDPFSEAPVSFFEIAKDLYSALASYGHEQATKRPLIFICQSIGGLVVKQALIEIHHQSAGISDFFGYTSGIMFFGTPHRATSSADSGLILQKNLRVAAGVLLMNQDLLPQVQLDSRVLNEMYQGFSHVAGKSLLIGSFYETQPTKRLGIITPRSSAMLDFHCEVCVALDTTHSRLCIFKSHADANYRRVLNRINSFCETILRENDNLSRSRVALLKSPAQVSLSQWNPCVASKKGITSMGLLEMAGSMEQPRDYLRVEMDIVAVHGLRGSPIRTWIDSSTQSMWLREMLQVDAPNTRVMSYGYRTDEVLRINDFALDRLADDLIENLMDARARIQNPARPLLFIAYSFGGLLVKKALLRLRGNKQQSTEMRQFLTSVTSVIFLGVPHDMGDPSFVHRWTSIVQCTTGIKRIESLDTAKLIDEIRQISADFRKTGHLEACSIAESEPTKVSPTQEKTILASAQSSRLGWEERETIFLARGKNHLELPKFVDKDDPAYICIRDSIKRALDRHGRVAGQRGGEEFLRALWQVDYEQRLRYIPDPHQRTCEWIYDTELMRSWLDKPGGILLIVGRPGSGKSVLTKRLVRPMPQILQPQATTILHYFIRFGNSGDTCEDIIGSFLQQIFKECVFQIKDLGRFLRMVREGPLGSLDVLINIFSVVIELAREKHFIAVIDGIDELDSGERQKIIKLLGLLAEAPKLGCIVSSRDTTDILGPTGRQCVTLSLSRSEGLRNDIEVFVSDSLKALLDSGHQELPSTTLQAVESLTVEHAAGSFLCAYLAVTQISSWVHDGVLLSEVVDRLKRLPRELQLLYEQLVAKIENVGTSDDVLEFRQILSILAVQRNSMRLPMLAEALQGDSSPTLSPGQIGDDYMQRLEFKIRALIPLVVSGFDGVTLAHTSVREYLLDMTRLGSSAITPINAIQAHADLARKCVTVLHRNLTAKIKPEDLERLRHGFTGYAAKNWVTHFQLGQELVDEKLVGLAGGLFQTRESPVTRWLTLYEKATEAALPHRQIFGPLFGGAYFGLTHVVKRALEVGCDINAVDSYGKTPFHWACERRHSDVAALLIDNGADVISQAFDGRTGLHYAAQNGDIYITKQLLATGISPDSVAFDGRTVLHLAVEASNTKVVEILLDAGADPTERTTSGLNAFQLASQSPTKPVLHLLLNSPTMPEKLLSKAIKENVTDMVALLIAHRLDVIELRYPWVPELVDEGLSSEEISSLLLQSENLQWIKSEEWSPRLSRIWSDLPAFTHQGGCAHWLVDNTFGDPVKPWMARVRKDNPGQSRLDRLAEEHGRQSQNRGVSSEYPPADDSQEEVPGELLEPLEFFARLEQREQKLLHRCGIAGVFPPWYEALNPGFAILLADQARIMYGEPDLAPIFFPIPTTPHHWALAAETSRRPQAGPGDNTDDDGSDTSITIESSSMLSNTSRTSNQTDSTYDSVSHASNDELWDQDLSRRILEALENVLNALHLLHSDSGCCNSFTILVKAYSRPRTVMVKRISVSLLLKLCEALDESLLAWDIDASSWTLPLVKDCTDFLEELECGEMVDKYLHNSRRSAGSRQRCLHVYALVTQMAAIGIVTYSRGHSREFYTPTLSRPIDSFVLLGADSAGPTLHAERLQLECMGKMLGRRVWVFHQNEDFIGNTDETFYLATSFEDLLDTWGGSISREDVGFGTAEYCLSIGGGSIVTAEPNDRTFDMAQDDELCCHWTSEPGLSVSGWDLVGPHFHLLIGATSVNEQCHLTPEVCQKAFSSGVLTSMGTRAAGWKTTGRAANLGIGFHGATVGVVGSQTKDDGRSLKAKIFQDWDRTTDLRVLNRPCGLEISLCTGIARRLPLREFFYGEVLEYLKYGLLGEWTKIQSVVADIPGQSEDEFAEWLSKLTELQTEVMQKATVLLLLAMEYTGVERGGHTLTIWWPEKNEATPRGLQIKKEQYSGKNPWISMFQDPERCVIFGLATSRCLEHRGLKTCQNTTTPARCEAVKEVMLDTSLVPAMPLINAAPLSYELNKRYILWHCRHIVRVTRASETTDEVVRLNFVPGTPYIVMQRLFERWEKVKEKETLGDKGQDVLVL